MSCEVYSIDMYDIYIYYIDRCKDLIMTQNIILNIVGENRLNRCFQDLTVMILIPLLSFRPVGYLSALQHRICLNRILGT